MFTDPVRALNAVSLVKVPHLLLRSRERRQVFKTKKYIYWGGVGRPGPLD